MDPISLNTCLIQGFPTKGTFKAGMEALSQASRSSFPCEACFSTTTSDCSKSHNVFGVWRTYLLNSLWALAAKSRPMRSAPSGVHLAPIRFIRRARVCLTWPSSAHKRSSSGKSDMPCQFSIR